MLFAYFFLSFTGQIEGPGSVIEFQCLGFQAGQSIASKLVRGAGFVVIVHSRFLWLRFVGSVWV